jgi:hypothetical protein
MTSRYASVLMQGHGRSNTARSRSVDGGASEEYAPGGPGVLTDPHRHVERRAADRPANGDAAACPNCADGTIVFSDRNRGADPTGSVGAIPAWVCDSCPHARPVRAAHQPQALRATAERLRAHAKRQLMKSRFVRARANRVIDKGLKRKKLR